MFDMAGHVQVCVMVVASFVNRASASVQKLLHSTLFGCCPFGTCIFALPSKLTTCSQTCQHDKPTTAGTSWWQQLSVAVGTALTVFGQQAFG